MDNVFDIANFDISTFTLGRNNLTFAVVPKHESDFFDVVRDGCVEQGHRIGANCHYTGPSAENAYEEQGMIIRDLADSGVIDGIAVSVVGGDIELTNVAIAYALSKGIPVITFDSDAPDSGRLSYIGTDNWAFGATLGKILLQLKPNGGTYGIIADPAPNIVERVAGLQSYLAGSTWKEAENSPGDCQGDIDKSHDIMEDFSLDEAVSAVISVGGWPMFAETDDRWRSIVNASRDTVTYVNSDSEPRQVKLLSEGYVDGLVGQVPFQWGVVCMNVLKQLVTDKRQAEVENEIYSTHFMEMIRVPLDLPEVVEDKNYIGNLRFVGFGLFIAVFFTTVAFALWAFMKRKDRIIRASQPTFLIMVCVGVLIMVSALIPLSLDDSKATTAKSDAVCMSIPWLSSIGFTVTFSALFSKTWRINKIFRNKSAFARMRVTPRDVILPFVALFSLDLIILICWTVLAPLTYVRREHSGTDEWNRVISTYGTCNANGSLPYILMLGAVNLAALLIALFQAFQARSIQSEFSESAYIGTAMVVILQASLIGFPILFLVQDDPQVFYLVIVMLNFVTSMAVLCLIFVPKISQRSTESSARRSQRLLRQSLRFDANPRQMRDATPSSQSIGSSGFAALVVSKFRTTNGKVKHNPDQDGAFGCEPEVPDVALEDQRYRDGLRINESMLVSWESGDEN